MPGKAIVMAFVWSGWLIASVIAFMIVAYASFFGVAVIGLMIWFVTAASTWSRTALSAPASRRASSRSRSGPGPRCRRRTGGLHGKQLIETQSTRFFRYLGIALTAWGLGGFLLFQI
jgi:hypothetical protein